MNELYVIARILVEFTLTVGKHEPYLMGKRPLRGGAQEATGERSPGGPARLGSPRSRGRILASIRKMSTQPDNARRFLSLHVPGDPLLLPNPWDEGSARVLASRGFAALATTSSGHAMSLGRMDGEVSRDEALAHAGRIVSATPLPVSADLERGFADDPAGVAGTVELAKQAGLAGCSIEDFTGRAAEPIYGTGLAAERIAAAAEAAHAGPAGLVLTARAENYLHGRPDLGDTIARLQAFQEAGADVLYAPGLTGMDDIRQLIRSVDRPVNVLLLPGAPSVPELAAAGVSRVSVGGAFGFAMLAALADAADELRGAGPYTFLGRAGAGRALAREAFGETTPPAG